MKILQNIAETLFLSIMFSLRNIILIGFCEIPLMLNVLLMTGPLIGSTEVSKTAPRHQRESPSQLAPKGRHERYLEGAHKGATNEPGARRSSASRVIRVPRLSQ